MARIRQFPSSVDPGKPSEPSVPEGWERVRFRDVLDVVERPVSIESNVEYQLVTAKRNRGGIEPRSMLRGSQIKVKQQYFVREGDFLISRRQIVHGACGVVPRELSGAIVSNEYDVLRSKPNLAVGYLELLSHTSYFQRTSFHSSVGVDIEKMVFRLQKWLDYRFPLPPLAEQEKIVAALSSVSEVIERAEQLIGMLERLEKLILEDILARGLPGRHSGYKPLKEKWRLGRLRGVNEIPAAWDFVKLVSVARLESGHTPSRAKPEYWDGGIPWVSLHDSRNLDMPEILDTAQKISDLGLANSSARLLPRGTVVFSRTATVGKATILGSEMATSQDFANYVCGDKLYNRYLMHFLRFNQLEWERLMAGSTHKTIYMPVFRELQILLPPYPEQVQIADIADSLDARIEKERRVIVCLRQLKSALSAALLTGQIRVTPDEVTP